MQAIFVVLNKTECLETLLLKLSEGGIKGGTIIESTGMARALGDSEDFNFFGSLRQLLDPERMSSKTLFFVVNAEQSATVRRIVDEVTGGIDKPDTGVLFGFSLDFVDGLDIK